VSRPTIFLRDDQGRLTNRHNPETLWVLHEDHGVVAETRTPGVGADATGAERKMRYLDEFRYYFRHDTSGVARILYNHPDGRMAQIAKTDFEGEP
jgi:hypothetical protein